MLVSVEVRMKLADQDGRCALLVQGNELRRSGRRVLIPFGGAIAATTQDAKLFGSLRPGDDLRFEVSPEQRRDVEALFGSLTFERILVEAKREFAEEAGRERGLLLPNEIAACRFAYSDKTMFEAVSLRSATKGQPMVYVIGIVHVHPPEPVLRKLLARSISPDAMVEFIAPHYLRYAGYTPKGSFVPSMYHYLA